MLSNIMALVAVNTIIANLDSGFHVYAVKFAFCFTFAATNTVEAFNYDASK